MGVGSQSFWCRIENLTFSDGGAIPLTAGTTLLIGPNNAGKSATLREIDQWLATQRSERRRGKVLKQVDVTYAPQEALHDWIKSHYPARELENGQLMYMTIGLGGRSPLTSGAFSPDYPRPLEEFYLRAHPYLCHRVDTQSRLNLANPVGAQDVYTNPPAAYIHVLQRDERIRRKISALVRQAFGVDLLINWSGGQQVWFHIGQEPLRTPESDRVSPEYAAALNVQPKLFEEGDGIRSFVGALLGIECAAHPILLIDEPESFLHPPQAFRLGAVIAQNADELDRQTIVATHSPDVVLGALSRSPNVAICRMTRTGTENHVALLPGQQVNQLWQNPLLRSSAAINGVFHQGVVVCEADSDCRFYEVLLRQVEKDIGTPMDLYLVHGGGKGAISTLAEAYRTLRIKTAVIADLDLLKNESEFRKLFGTLGGALEDIATLYKAVVASLNDRKPTRPASEFVDLASDILARVKQGGSFNSSDKVALQALIGDASDWSEAKRYGIEKLQGGAYTDAQRLLDKCKTVGLFLVPVGELERWWRAGPADKAAWILATIPKLSNDPTVFESARGFMKEVCAFAHTC